MPDTFNQEIEKILLDKGILAIIAVVITFRFSRILERFKSKSAMGNVIYELRFKAYNEIMQILVRHGFAKRQVINKLIELQVTLNTPESQVNFMSTADYESHTGTSFEKEFKQLDADFRLLTQRFSKSCEEINDSVSKSILFLSADFVSKLNEYTNSLDLYKETFAKFDYKVSKDSVQPIIESLSDKTSTLKFGILQKQMLDELDGRIT